MHTHLETLFLDNSQPEKNLSVSTSLTLLNHSPLSSQVWCDLSLFSSLTELYSKNNQAEKIECDHTLHAVVQLNLSASKLTLVYDLSHI